MSRDTKNVETARATNSTHSHIDSLLDELNRDMKNILTSSTTSSTNFSASNFFTGRQNYDYKKASQNILQQFSLLGFFSGYEDEMVVSDSLNVIGITGIEFPRKISFNEIEKIVGQLKLIGLSNSEAKSLIGLPNKVNIEMKIDELEAWLIDKVKEKCGPSQST